VDWVKLHTRYYADDKIEALPDADAEIMFVRGLARAGEVEREGFIPAESLPKLARRRRYAASVSALLAAGLWTKVPGGYQVTNWDHWQDGLDALARRRTADRERQRRRRAAERESTRESRDKPGASRDGSRDVTPLEGEEEREGVQVGDIGEGSARASPEPPSKCLKHIDTPKPPACGACADARKAHERWKADRAARLRDAPKCRRHRGQLAENCSSCRSELLERTGEFKTITEKES